MDSGLNKLIGNNIFAVTIILLITFLVYINSFQNGFVIEDPIYVSDWKLTQSLSNIPKMFAGDTAPTGNYGIYRPVRGVFYALSYALFGGSNPLPYHILALAVHLFITALIYLITRQIVHSSWFIVHSKDTKLLATNYQLPTMNYLPFITALLFGLHPVHTEPVNYITANFDAISYIFFFGAFYFFLRATLHPKQFTKEHITSFVLSGLAFFHFEMTLTLPLLLLLYGYCFKFKSLKFFKDPKVLKFYAPYFALAGFFLFLRVFVFNMTVRGEYLAGSFFLTMLTMVKAVIKYLILLIFPLDLSINPTISEGINSWVHPLSRMDKILSQRIFDLDILLYLTLIVVLIAVSVKFIRQLPLLSFSILWFFISILPVLYIIPQGPVLQERYVYIASFGYVLLLAYGIFWISEKAVNIIQSSKFKMQSYNLKLKSNQTFAFLAVLLTFTFCILTFYGIRTFTRNFDWKDSFAVWSKLVQQSPNDVIANFSTGNIYFDRKMYDKALPYFFKTLSIEPRLHESHFAIGKIFYDQGNIDGSATHLQQALAINPNFAQAKTLLDDLNKGIDASDSAQIKPENIWRECKIKDEVVFSCPQTWIITDTSTGGKNIKDPDSSFNIEISLDNKDANELAEDYLKGQNDNLGNLLNQGLADFLNSELTYVKVFEEVGIQKLQFFLFKGTRVVKIVVFPTGNQNQMSKFDRLASSIVVSGAPPSKLQELLQPKQ